MSQYTALTRFLTEANNADIPLGLFTFAPGYCAKDNVQIDFAFPGHLVVRENEDTLSPDDERELAEARLVRRWLKTTFGDFDIKGGDGWKYHQTEYFIDDCTLTIDMNGVFACQAKKSHKEEKFTPAVEASTKTVTVVDEYKCEYLA